MSPSHNTVVPTYYGVTVSQYHDGSKATCHINKLLHCNVMRWQHGSVARCYVAELPEGQRSRVLACQCVRIARCYGGTMGARADCEDSYMGSVPSSKSKKLFLHLHYYEKESQQKVNRPRGYGVGKKEPRHTVTAIKLFLKASLPNYS